MYHGRLVHLAVCGGRSSFITGIGCFWQRGGPFFSSQVAVMTWVPVEALRAEALACGDMTQARETSQGGGALTLQSFSLRWVLTSAGPFPATEILACPGDQNSRLFYHHCQVRGSSTGVPNSVARLWQGNVEQCGLHVWGCLLVTGGISYISDALSGHEGDRFCYVVRGGGC